MRLKIAGLAALLAIIGAPAAQAQISNMLQGAMGSGAGGTGSLGNLGGLGGMSMPSLGAASPTNLAGVLQYCVQNNDLGGGTAGAAETAKQSLLDKFTGASSSPSSNPSYASGSQGLLSTGNGQSMSLGGGGLKAALTQKICAQVLKHAQSLL
ncbi:MAG: DUF2501 domain-containing protein [Acidocella sp.]|nr:DUF2501 domain-containing protein [Acidocella sp.]